VFRIVDITCDNKEVRLRCNRVIHHTPERTQGCRLQPRFQRCGSGHTSAKRAIEMKVCSMDESQRVHVEVCMAYTGQIRSLQARRPAGRRPSGPELLAKKADVLAYALS